MSELLDVVDRDNTVIEKATRADIHNSDLWHRGSHVLLFNTKEEILLQHRSKTRDKFPDTLDCSASGHTLAGDTYEQTAQKELEEELGVKDIALKKILLFRMHYGTHDNMISALYEGSYDGPFTIDPKEIIDVRFYPQEKIREMIKQTPEQFSSWTLEILKWYFHLPSRVEKLA
ncbi:MAG: NUDIX domain-containing protein [Candidatus Aenigmarchaeota archaeon]|nr:NUDIX domain-containing protein [Candidatus Aenigmarchaeota archaeon]